MGGNGLWQSMHQTLLQFWKAFLPAAQQPHLQKQQQQNPKNKQTKTTNPMALYIRLPSSSLGTHEQTDWGEGGS